MLVIASLFVAIMFTIVNFGRMLAQQEVGVSNFVLQTAGIVTFIWSMGWLN